MAANERIKALLQKDFPWRDRLMLSVLAGFTFAFTFFFFGFLDLFAGNYSELPIEFSAVLLVALVTFFVVWIGVSAVLLIFPGKFYSVALSLTIGLLLAGYLQGTFLNIYLGELTGDSIAWESYWKQALVNTAIWLILLAAPLFLRYLNKGIWKKAVIIICVLISGMQSAALISTLITSKATEVKNIDEFLTTHGNYEVSAQNNILVFVLDRLDYNYINAVREDDPTFFDKLDGFTDFNNTTALYCRTYPSSTFMITGIKGFFDKPAVEYFDEAWNNSAFIPLLKQHNYTTKYHIDYGYTYNDNNQIRGKADNLETVKMNPPWLQAAKNFTKLSLYRYAPHCLKASFWIPGLNFTNPQDIVTNDDPLFYQLFLENGLIVQNKKNNYLFLGLNGSHGPYIMDENAQYVGESDLVRQTKGSFQIVYSYMEELKKLGLYKDATIIITGDHGKSTDITPLDYASTVGFFVKPKGSEGTPLQQNSAPVSHENLLPTILKSEGLDYSAFGVSAFDVAQDADVVRHFYYRLDFADGRHVLEHFEIYGDAKDFANWRKIEDIPAPYMP